MRTALFRRPDWSGLVATPAAVTCLFLAPLLVNLFTEWLYIEGPAQFYWQGLAGGWVFTVLVLLTCWIVTRSRREYGTAPRDAASLFAMLCAQGLPLSVLWLIAFVPIARSGAFAEMGSVVWPGRVLWLAIVAWLIAAPALLLARSSPRHWPLRTFAVLAVTAAFLGHWLVPSPRWYPAPSASAANGAAPARLRLTQQLMEQQAELLPSALRALKPQRRGLIDVYVLTYAPFATEEVFRRESAMVADVMKHRFDADGHVLQLVNHASTGAEHPWATPLNLQRAIRHVAALMDRDEDVLFVHLTSHGAREGGSLASSFWPLEVEPVTPQTFKTWLDEAGVKNRIISVSACFSGTWIAPLADANTLVVTASDSEHTSYGCGRKSELTYFGRAMYDEGLRTTGSFEAAYAGARTVIGQREKEAGKDDGFSNPQIAIGAEMRERLKLLEAQRAAGAR